MSDLVPSHTPKGERPIVWVREGVPCQEVLMLLWMKMRHPMYGVWADAEIEATLPFEVRYYEQEVKNVTPKRLS